MILYCAFALAADPVVDCEDALLRPVYALLQLTQKGLEKRILTLEELRTLFAYDRWANPFALHVGNSEALALRRVFEANAKDLKPDQKQKFRTELAILLSEEEQQHVVADEARRATQTVLAPSVIPFPAKYLNESFTSLNLRWLDGRPVAIGTISRPSFSVDVLLDPMNPQNEHVIEFDHQAITQPNYQGYEPFTVDTQKYVLRLRDREVFKLPSGERTSLFDHRLNPPVRNGASLYSEGSVLVAAGDQLKLVTAWMTGGTPDPKLGHLGIASLDRFDLNVAPISTGNAWGIPRAHTLDGHQLVSWTVRKRGLEFVDLSVSPRKVFPLIEAGESCEEFYPVTYVVNGQWRTMFLKSLPGAPPRLVVADIETGKVLRTLDVRLDVGAAFLSSTEVNGLPFAQLRTNAGVLWIDLVHETTHLFRATDIDTAVNSFVFRGQPYLTWGTHAMEMAVLDVNGGTIVRTKIPCARRLQDVLPFVYRGLPFAFVGGYGMAPVLVEMMREVR